MDMYEYTEQCTLYNYEHEIFIDYHKWATQLYDRARRLHY